MSDIEKMEQTEKGQDEHEIITGGTAEAESQLRRTDPGLRERVRKLPATAQQHGPATKRELAKDRTWSMALLIGGTVGAVLLFVGVFSTPTTAPVQEARGHAAPNMGRPAVSSETTPHQASVTPLLNADVRSDESNSDQLSPADIGGTSQRASGSDETKNPSETVERGAAVPRVATPQLRNLETGGSSSSAGSDPLAPYRVNNSTGAPTYRYGAPASADADTQSSRTFSYSAVAPARPENHVNDQTSVKSSIVFIRTPGSPETIASARSAPVTPLDETSLLPPGTRLVARLEAAATTAVKTPVVASIEYNYEHDGMIVVPAGTKAIGDVQQASSEGYLSIRFHTLRMPDGKEEKIEGAGLALDHKPLKGEVSGKNTGKKVLSRTLSGVGTIAAYIVGAGGAGLARPVTGETLLRDRLAGNIALAGEQELANAAYSQNISVTVAANTRFYLVLQKAAVNSIAPPSAPPPPRTSAAAAPSAEIPTVQELRELMDLRREINRMYQESNSPLPQGLKPQP